MPSTPSQGQDLFDLASLTAAELGEIASAAAGVPVVGAEVTATPIAYDWGSPATAGLWRADVRGHAESGPLA